MYSENYKTISLLKDIKDLKKWKDDSCSWIRRLQYCQDGSNLQIDL